MKSFLTVLGGFVAVSLLIIYGAFVQGFVLFRAWGWFAPIIKIHYIMGFHSAIAVMLIANLFRLYSTSLKGKEDEDKYVILGTALIAPWIILLILWGFTFIL
jgi:hypothetical protein